MMSDDFEYDISLSINAVDILGREEYYETTARKAFRKGSTRSRSGPRVKKFMPPDGSNQISVNRLGISSDTVLAEIGKRNAALQGRSFWGWYVLPAKDICDSGCTVRASPLPENLYHADIEFPVALDAEERRDALIGYATELAYCADFRPWGEWTKNIS